MHWLAPVVKSMILQASPLSQPHSGDTEHSKSPVSQPKQVPISSSPTTAGGVNPTHSASASQSVPSISHQAWQLYDSELQKYPGAQAEKSRSPLSPGQDSPCSASPSDKTHQVLVPRPSSSVTG